MGYIAPISGSGTGVTWLAKLGANWSPQSMLPFNFQLDCEGSSAIPWLTSSGVPTLGTSYSVDLWWARPTTAAVLLWSATTASFDLGFINAPGCKLYVGTAPISQPAATNATGFATWPQLIPNNTALCGAVFYQQALIVDPPANGLTIVTSRRGIPLLGN